MHPVTDCWQVDGSNRRQITHQIGTALSSEFNIASFVNSRPGWTSQIQLSGHREY